MGNRKQPKLPPAKGTWWNSRPRSFRSSVVGSRPNGLAWLATYFIQPRHSPRGEKRPLARFGGPRTKSSRTPGAKSTRENAYLGRKELPIAFSGQSRAHVMLARPLTVRLKARPGRGYRPSYPRRTGRRVKGLPTTPTTGGIGPRLEAGVVICIVQRESSAESEGW